MALTGDQVVGGKYVDGSPAMGCGNLAYDDFTKHQYCDPINFLLKQFRLILNDCWMVDCCIELGPLDHFFIFHISRI